MPAKQLVGQLGCWTYFESIKSPANKKFVADFKAWLAKSTITGLVKEGRVTCSPMVLSYDGVYLWKACVEKAGSFEAESVELSQITATVQEMSEVDETATMDGCSSSPDATRISLEVSWWTPIRTTCWTRNTD